MSQLHQAIKNGDDVNMLQTLALNHPQSLIEHDEHGRLPLQSAVQSNCKVEVIRSLLLQHSEGARLLDEKGQLPLHYAAASNTNVEVVQLLLEQYPESVKVADKDGSLPLHAAARSNTNVEVVQLLLAKYSEGARLVDKNGRLPLHYAAGTNSNVRVVQLLLEQYLQGLMVVDKDGSLPFHYAAGTNSNVEVVQWLLQQHPDVLMVPGKDGRLPLHFAAGNTTNVDMLRWSYGHPHGVVVAKNYCEQQLAKRNSNVDVVRLLVYQYPLATMMTDKNGGLPLHWALRNNSNMEVVRLLDHPHSVVVEEKDGSLPLHAAAGRNSHAEVIRWLINRYPKGAMSTNKEGQLPLHYAAASNTNVEVVQLLLEQYPESVKVADKDGWLPLHWAALHNTNVEVVQLLLAKYSEGARLVDKDGWLPLHWAAFNNSDVDVVRLLLEKHPEGVTTADKDGWLPLHYAAGTNSNVEIVFLLMGDGTLYFRRSVSFLTQEVVSRLNDCLTDKRRLHEFVGGLVEYSLMNPHHATSLRKVFDFHLGLFNLQKGFTGALMSSWSTANVHMCGEKLAGKTTLTSWLQQKLQQRTTWIGRASTVFSRPKMATVIDFEERTPGLLIHQVDNPQEVQFVLHDYGGHEEFRTVYRQFLNVPQSIYVVVLPLVEKRSDTDHRPHSIEVLESQYRQWLGQIHNALQGASSARTSKTAVITVLNKFVGVFPEAEMPRRSEIRKRLHQCQQEPAFRSTFEFYPCVTVDCRNEHDVMSVCLALETWVTQQRALPEVHATTTAVTFPVVQHLRDSFERRPMANQLVEETQYQLEVRRRLIDEGYREEDELPGSLDLLVRWWVADSLRTRRILRLTPGSGKEAIIVTSVDALSHWLFGKVLDDMRRRSAVVVRRATVRDIVRETIQGSIDAADLLVDVGLFMRIVAYDANSGRVDLQPPSATASDNDLFLVVGLIDQRVGDQDMRPPEFRAETTRRIHRWYTLDREAAVDWGPDFFVTLFQCVMSLVPSCAGPRIFKDGIYAMAEDGQRRTTYIVRPHRHESLGDGFDVIVDVSTEDVTAMKFQDITRQDDDVWMGLQAINATCRRLVGGSGLREYCVYPDARSMLSPRWVVDVERELTQAETQGLTARFQLQKYLYGYFPLERVTLQGLMANLPQRLTAGEVTNDQLAAAIQLLHRSLELSVVYTQSIHSQFSESMALFARQVAELHDATETAANTVSESTGTAAAVALVPRVAPGLTVGDNERLLAMEMTLNNLFRAQLSISRNLCDFPLLVFLQPAPAQSLGAIFSSMFTKRYRVCCVCPVCGQVAPSEEAYELRVSRGKWRRYLLRALQASMILAGVALKAAGVPTLVADVLYSTTANILSDVSKELGALVDAYRDDITSAMTSRMEGFGETAAAELTGPPSNAAAAAVNTIGQQPLDRERQVSWEYIRAMKTLFAESLNDPEAAGSGLARIWSDDGDVAFVCADGSRSCREQFRREGRKCLRVVAVYGG